MENLVHFPWGRSTAYALIYTAPFHHSCSTMTIYTCVGNFWSGNDIMDLDVVAVQLRNGG